MYCPKCGKDIESTPAFCPHCGTRLSPGQAANKPKLSMIAGVLDIISGVLGLLMGLGFLIFLIVVLNLFSGDPDLPDGIFYVTVLPGLLLAAGGGLVAIIGGIYALRRTNWGVALVGSIAAALGMGVLGIAALVLTALSRDEFER